ncbi:hypothetical protein [Microbulbifer sp. JSM ZJ756]|uniref:hypothetical protein n=1 Tax=Microbulbifer sp. JSM ZJ756 TaxID=3376191 RepID=UPI0037BBC3D2
MHIEFTPTRLVADAGDGVLAGKLKSYQGGEPQPEGRQHMALGGNTETTLFRLVREYKCQTVPMRLDGPTLKKWHAFAASVAAGEFFTFDGLGTAASPDDPRQVQLKFGSFKQPQRKAGRIFVFSFTIVEFVT